MDNLTLIIAEKRDVATKLADYFTRHGNTFTLEDGYFASDPKGKYETTYITWLAGHIMTDYIPEDYNPEWHSWARTPLPIFPEEFKRKPLKDKERQYKIVRNLISRASLIVNAGDPDREGQVLVDELLDDVRGRVTIKRLLLSGLNDEMIGQALNGMKSDEEFHGLYRSGVTRANIDWLIGINFTRHFSILWNKGGQSGTVPIGRVKTPTVALVVKREKKIKDFKPQNWYTITADVKIAGRPVKITLDAKDKITDLEMANSIKNSLIGKSFLVHQVTPEHHEESVKALYQLNTLQIDADKYCDIDAKETAEAAESLYLAGYTSYPRTECRYLPESQRQEAPVIAKALNEKVSAEIGVVPTGEQLNENVAKSPVYNDKKLGAHHALVPTTKVPDLDKLKPVEKAIYLLIVKKYVSIFYPPYTYDTVKVTGTIGEYPFTFSFRRITDFSWTSMYVPYKKKGKDTDDIPDLDIPISSGSVYAVIAADAKKQTNRPPKRYTEATLIAAMANARSKKEELNKTLREIKGIGTSATQSKTIEELLSSSKSPMLAKKGKEIYPTDLAMLVTELLPEILTEPDYTAIMENNLADIVSAPTVAEQAEKEKDLIDQTKTFVSTIIADNTDPIVNHEFPCPSCGNGYVVYHHWKDKDGTLHEYARCSNPECKKYFPFKDGKPYMHTCPACGKGTVEAHAYIDKATGERREYGRCSNPECGEYWPMIDGIPKTVHCPECHEGWIKEKKGKQGYFYSCSRFPSCKKTITEEELRKTKE